MSYQKVRAYRVADISNNEKIWLPKSFFTITPVTLNKELKAYDKMSALPEKIRNLKEYIRPQHQHKKHIKLGIFKRTIEVKNDQFYIKDNLLHTIE